MSDADQVFLLPPVRYSERWQLPADLYNHYRTMLNRSQGKPVHIPLRALQHLAVLADDIRFIDSHAYGVDEQSGVGGQLTAIVWTFDSAAHQRNSLTLPVPCKVSFHTEEADDLQSRLVVEFGLALQSRDRRYRRSRNRGAARVTRLHRNAEDPS